MTSYSIRCIGPAAAVLTLALAGCSGLGGDGRLREDPLGNIEQRVIGETLSGLGIAAPNRERIDYSPRGPLAMPPRGANGGQLPPPQNPETAQAPANWPRDPDAMRREAARRENSRPMDHRFERERDGRRMTIEEMEAQRNTGPRPSGGQQERFRDTNVVLGRDELERGWQRPEGGGGIFSVDETVDMTRGRQEEGQGAARRYIDEQAGATGGGPRGTARIDTRRLAGQTQEPPRRSLIDPPTGLRTPQNDPTGGAVTSEDRQNQNLWDRLFGR